MIGRLSTLFPGTVTPGIVIDPLGRRQSPCSLLLVANGRSNICGANLLEIGSLCPEFSVLDIMTQGSLIAWGVLHRILSV